MPRLSVIARRNKELIVVVFVGVVYTKELKLASLIKYEKISYLVQTLGSTGVMISCFSLHGICVCRILCVIAGGTDGNLKMLRGQMQSDPYGVINTTWLQFLALFLLSCTVSFIDTVSNVNVII